jgi:hypothetical protein
MQHIAFYVYLHSRSIKVWAGKSHSIIGIVTKSGEGRKQIVQEEDNRELCFIAFKELQGNAA